MDQGHSQVEAEEAATSSGFFYDFFFIINYLN